MSEVNIRTTTKEKIAFELMTTIAHASCRSNGKFKKKQKSENYWLDLYDKCLLSVLHIQPNPQEKPLGKPPITPVLAKQNGSAIVN
ncbi:MAG: hypothetical protein H7Z73_00550 [Candidatus Saccharibacteria bacterium]|nr:hypothetical protein [Moraxellaceae bacterium]